MQRIGIGGTGAQIGIFGLGTMCFGTAVSEKEVFAQLDLFVEKGGTLIDTADMYAYWLNRNPGEEGQGGASERVIGRWLRQRRRRSQVFIASKVGNPTSQAEEQAGGWGLSAERIVEHCEQSLGRLGVETIDLYYAHCDDRRTPVEESLAAFDRLVRTGKVRFIGASNWMSWRMEEAYQICRRNGWATFSCLQQKHSYLRPKPGQDLGGFQLVTEEVVDHCRQREVTLLGHEPILKATYLWPEQKLFDGRYDYETADNRARLAELYKVAGELGATPIQIVLAWMVESDPPVVPLIAADTAGQLRENLQAAELRLEAELMRRLNAAGA
jgi:aryl-alcohol dehydrogenase-like predicted oxidoreductase